MGCKVCFTMRAYNAERYIREALDSLLAQTEPDWRLLLEDNGSTDATGRICDSYAARDSRIRCFHTQRNNNRTADEEAVARQLAAEYITVKAAEYIAVLDADDYYQPDFIAVLYTVAKRSGAAVIIGGTRLFDEAAPAQNRERIPPDGIFGRQLSLHDFRAVYASLRPLWGKLYRTDAWLLKEQLTPNDGIVCNGFDTYQNLRLLACSDLPLAGVGRILHSCRVHQGSVYTGTADARRFHEGALLFQAGLTAARRRGLAAGQAAGFLYRVYLQHCRDVAGLIVTAELPAEEKIRLLQPLLQEELFAHCAGLFAEEAAALLHSAVQAIWDEAAPAERGRLYRYLLVRLYKEPPPLGAKTALVWLFSILCSKDNLFHWGSDCFAGITAAKAAVVVDSMQEISAAEQAELGQQLAAAWAVRDEVGVEALLACLQAKAPLARDTLYWEICVHTAAGRHLQSGAASAVAEVFWEQDEKISALLAAGQMSRE